MREWDPIGVADVPEAANEYDTYVAKAYVLPMHEQADEYKLAQYLSTVERLSMGISSVNAEAIRRAVAALIKLRDELER